MLSSVMHKIFSIIMDSRSIKEDTLKYKSSPAFLVPEVS